MGNRSFEIREHQLPGPNASSGYKTILVLGATGSGKTTLIRQMLGTQATGEDFPAVSRARTTIAENEILLAPGPYYAVATFLSKDEVRTLIEENLIASAVAMAEGRSKSSIVRSLLEHTEQRFRLRYLLGDVDSVDDPAEPYATILAKLKTLVSGVVDLDAADQSRRDLDQDVARVLAGNPDFGALVESVLQGVRSRVDRIEQGTVHLDDTEAWPEFWTMRSDHRAEFFRALIPISSNHADHFGATVSPIIDGLRIRGPLRPTWSNDDLYLMFVDSEGLGHTVDTIDALPADVVDQLDRVDTIVLADNALQPMQAATFGALRQIAATGHATKLAIAFTHFDGVQGPNFASTASRRMHLDASLEQAVDRLGRELGDGVRRTLHHVADHRRVFLEDLNRALDPMGDAETVSQIDELITLCRRGGTGPIEGDAPELVVSSSVLRAHLVDGLQRFHSRWRALLGLEATGSAAAWSQIRALSRRFSERQAEEYKDLRPITDFASTLTTAVRRGVSEPVEDTAASDQDHADRLEDLLARSVHSALVDLGRRQIRDEGAAHWLRATVLSGSGSARVRAELIADEILGALLPTDDTHPLFAGLEHLVHGHATGTGYRLHDGRDGPPGLPEPPPEDSPPASERDDPAPDEDLPWRFPEPSDLLESSLAEVEPREPSADPAPSGHDDLDGSAVVPESQPPGDQDERGEDTAKAPEISTGGRESEPPSPRWGEPISLNRSLIDRLTGARVVGEIGVTARLHEEIVEAVSELSKRGHAVPARWGDQYPGLVAAYLVTEGIFRYRSGSFWPELSVPALLGPNPRQGLCESFDRALDHLGLEPFYDMVAAEGAQRYVSRILAHGGIPVSSLSDYFRVLHAALARGLGSAPDILEHWRSRPSSFSLADVPVARFLVWGGPLAVDFLDRSIDLVAEVGASGPGALGPRDSGPRASESDTWAIARSVGLAPYIVAGYLDHRANHPDEVTDADQVRALSHPPTVEIDPWDPRGPFVRLPAVDREELAIWAVNNGDRQHRFEAWRHQSRDVPLHRASAWSVSCTIGEKAPRLTVFEAQLRSPVLLFDPADGRYIPASSGVRSASVWALRPTDDQVEIRAVAADGTVEPPDIVEVLPDQGGQWSGYRVDEISLVGLRALEVDAGGAAVRIPTGDPTGGTSLETEPLAGVTSVAGVPVFDQWPVVSLPADIDPSTVVVRLRIGYEEWTTRSADMCERLDGSDQYRIRICPPGRSRSSVSRADLVVRTRLGSDLRLSFGVIDGLTVSRPDRIALPRDPAPTVHVVVGDELWLDGRTGVTSASFSAAAGATDVAVAVSGAEGDVALRVRVDRLLWGIGRASEPLTELGAEVRLIDESDILDGEVNMIAVRAGRPGVDVTLGLYSRGWVRQQVPARSTSGREGRQTLSLAPFRDTIADMTSGGLVFVLTVGAVPIEVARVRSSFVAANLVVTARVASRSTHLSITWDHVKQMSGRVLRLWSRSRPWDPPVTERIPDSTVGEHLCTIDDLLPSGDYLVEIVIDDGWTTTPRPRGAVDGVIEVTVGDAADITARRDHLAGGDAHDLLELAVGTGRVPRKLNEAELAEVAEDALLAAVVALYQEPRSVATREFQRTVDLIVAGRCHVPQSLSAIASRPELDPGVNLHLAIELAPRLMDKSWVAFADDDLADEAWSASAALAALLELRTPLSHDAGRRIGAHLGHDPTDIADEIEFGGPLDQVQVALDAGRLEELRAVLDLVPRGVLTGEEYQLANFEWLAANVGSGEAQHWFRRWSVRVEMPPDELGKRVERRRARPGTEQHGSVPALTLAAWYHVLLGTDIHREAMDALHEAVGWAPRLVHRDLLLAMTVLRGQLIQLADAGVDHH